MKKAVPIIAALLMLVSLPSRGQLPELERPEVLPASPEASKLAAYISYPVSLANGLVQTSIPLYEIVDGDIRIPITLSYHASGLKANMRSGHWLGDGWSLTTGPSLSRTINGVADEINYDASIALSDSPTYQQLEAISTSIEGFAKGFCKGCKCQTSAISRCAFDESREGLIENTKGFCEQREVLGYDGQSIIVHRRHGRNGIFVFVLPTRNIENEKEED
jgi:hypothetical protein